MVIINLHDNRNPCKCSHFFQFHSGTPGNFNITMLYILHFPEQLICSQPINFNEIAPWSYYTRCSY